MTRTEYLLVCLGEEAAEVQQMAAKSVRFGLDDRFNGHEPSNAVRLIHEIIDMFTIVEMLVNEGQLDRFPEIDAAKLYDEKRAKVEHWYQYAVRQGVVNEG